MAIMPDPQDRAALSAPLLPRPASLSSSTSSSFSASSSPAADAAAAAPMPMPMPRDNACCKALAVLRDVHPGGGSVSCLSLCGEFLLSASTGADIVAWQQPDLRRFARFGHGGEGAVKALAASGGRVFSAHQDGRVRVWRVSRCRASSENAFKLVAALPTARDYLGRVLRQASCYDGAVVQSRRRRGGRRCLWIEHSDSISCLALHDGNVYSGSWDKTLKVWRMADLRCLESIHAHDDAINAVAADAGIVYSASADGRVKAWEKGKGGSHSLQGILVSRDGVSWNAVAAVSADGGARRRVYAAGSDGHVVGWDRLGGGVRWSVACDVKAHAMAVLCLCVAGDLVCTGSADKTIGLWRRQTSGGGLARIGAVGGHEGPVKCLQASWCRASNGCMVYSGGLDKSIRVWWVPGSRSGGDEQRDEKGTEDDDKPLVFLR